MTNTELFKVFHQMMRTAGAITRKTVGPNHERTETVKIEAKVFMEHGFGDEWKNSPNRCAMPEPPEPQFVRLTLTECFGTHTLLCELSEDSMNHEEPSLEYQQKFVCTIFYNYDRTKSKGTYTWDCDSFVTHESDSPLPKNVAISRCTDMIERLLFWGDWNPTEWPVTEHEFFHPAFPMPVM